jgi:hypothetical protein
MKELIYTEHQAGSFEDGIQICTLCAKVICNYAVGEWVSNTGEAPHGFPEGPIYVTGTNPVQWTTVKPLENYGGDDPYTRKIVKCSSIKPAYSFRIKMDPDRLESLRSFIKPVPAIVIPENRPVTEVEAGHLQRMMDLGIFPFTLTDQFGNKYQAYMVDDHGKYWGTKNKSE